MGSTPSKSLNSAVYSYKLFEVTPEDDRYFKDKDIEILGVDTEANLLDIFDPEWIPTHISWSFDRHHGYVSTLANIPPTVRGWLTDRAVLKVFHNAEHDFKTISIGMGIEVWPFVDTMVIRHCIDPTKTVSEGLKLQGREMGGMPFWNSIIVRLAEISERGGIGKNDFWPPQPEYLLPYAAGDAVATLRLYLAAWSLLSPEECNLVHTLAMGQRTLARTEETGILLDVPLLEKIIKENDTIMTEAEAEVYAYSLIKNIRSGVQIGRWLYDEKGIPCPKVTEKGGRSTDEDALSRLGDTPSTVRKVVDAILAYRSAKKQTEKCEKFLTNVDEYGILHTRFNATGTLTGRLSSSPNVQNLERQGPLRRCIISKWR